MLSLIIETATDKGLIVLAKDSSVLKTVSLNGGPMLSRTLASEVNALLQGKVPDLVVCGEGPGSYTGVRVGAALAKALSFGWGAPLAGYCSLRAFGPAPVLFDARGNGFYALLGDEPELVKPDDPRLKDLTCFSSPTPERIKERLGSHLVCLSDSPDAEWLAKVRYERPFALNYLSHP